ncbi:MAG: proton-conducting transporter membrane subunit [Eubacteriales bacterium]|nr:proton-conducting transporter membrane subunit [Eubacteriales bacterium]
MPTILLIFLPLVPMMASVPGYLLAKKSKSAAYAVLISICLAATLLSGFLFLRALNGRFLTQESPGICALGLSLRADGFRSLYLFVASFMWLMTSLFTPEYLAHGHRHGRYIFFTLFTFGATLGVFLSDDLITAFVFFEIMSFTSYPWVAHEENPAAMRAAATYLAIAILGGMAMLMGLMMLRPMLGTLSFERLLSAAQEMPDKGQLYVPSLLILAGFGAKAGMFPLHVWLPKAHPVAPAPASALLSGILTKVGVFGILVISCRVLLHDAAWGNLLLILGLITMFAGAFLALLSVDLKRTLACSSMSQIGFILVGIGMQGLLGEHNALAAQGTILHMLNHSLIKLTLFMAAGAVYIGVHKLDLNEIRGYGRKKPFLHLCFLIGAASISGIPLFSGYVSKTLLHESIVEYVVHLQHLGENAFWYQTAEWVFVITGGMTFAYMLKLYFALFWEKNNRRQTDMDSLRRYLKPLSRFALGGAALVLFILGIRPQLSMTPLANAALPFMNAHAPEHAVDYFSAVNLLGTGKSLLIGLLLYLTLVRLWLVQKQADGKSHYVDRKPIWLDLEDSVYRPLLHLVVAIGGAFATLCHRLPEFDPLRHMVVIPAKGVAVLLNGLPDLLFFGMRYLGKLFARVFSGLLDCIAALMGRTVFAPPKPQQPVPIGNRFTYTLGRIFNFLAGIFKRMRRHSQPVVRKYTYLFAALWEEIKTNFNKVSQSLSFSLMLFSIGLLITLVYLMAR